MNKKGRFHVTVCKSCRAPREARGWYFHWWPSLRRLSIQFLGKIAASWDMVFLSSFWTWRFVFNNLSYSNNFFKKYSFYLFFDNFCTCVYLPQFDHIHASLHPQTLPKFFHHICVRLLFLSPPSSVSAVHMFLGAGSPLMHGATYLGPYLWRKDVFP